MWGALAKVGGAILAGLGVDWAVSAVQDSQAAAAENAQMQRQAKWGKFILFGVVAYLGYRLLSKVK